MKKTEKKKKSGLLMWLPFLVFLLMTVVMALVHRWFGQPWSGVCAFFTYGGYLLYGLLSRKKRQQELDAEMEELDAEMAELDEEFPIPEAGDGETLPFLLLHHNFNARYYQVFRSAKAYRFVHVGNEFKGIDPDRLLEECPTETQMTELKKSFSVRKEDVQRFTIEIKKSAMATPLPTSGVVTFYAPKKMRYDLLFEVTPQQAEHFFSDLRDRTEKKEKAYYHQKRRSDKNMSLGQWRRENQNPGTFKILKMLTLLLTIAGAALSLAFFFLPVPYELTAWVLVVLSLAGLALPMIFPAYYSLTRTAEEAKEAEGVDCISWIAPTIACNFALALRSLSDFSFINDGRLFAVVGIVGGVLAVIYTLRCRELQWKIGQIFCLLFLLLYASMGLSGELNYLLDTSEVVIEEKVVLDMHISTSSKGPDSYYCTVELQGKEVDIDIGREAYQTITVGETVEVGTKQGALGMAYSQIRKMD